MRIQEKIKTWIGLLMDKPYLPRQLLEAKGPLLLHISDTPEEIYEYIVRLIKKLQPDYIIHTGDLVDNIKLEVLPEAVDDYSSALGKFLPQLESVEAKEIYYTLGNHDNSEVVREITEKGIVMEEGNIMVEGVSLYINHYHIDKTLAGDYYLFGHSFEPDSSTDKNQVKLNGLMGINIIDLTTKQVYILPYPFATNQFRKMEKRGIGL
ncbi:metallophosphoesterase [Natronincola peptidivorans]|nr:metallophosphoesterase [Natronincola peptidivorans]